MQAMAVVEAPLRVFFIPLMSPGHMIPMVDMAKLFCRHGASATIVTTPGNEPLVRPSLASSSSSSSSSIELLLLPFPSSATEFLPDGQENLTFMLKSDHGPFFNAFFALRPSLEALLRAHKPDCVVTDSMYTWTSDAAAALGIPRLVFYGHGTFAQCVHESLHLRGTHKKKVVDAGESFLVEGIPDRVELRRSEVSSIFQWEAALDSSKEAEEKSFGVVVNSFYGLEPEYAELYRRKPGRKVWCVGPVSLANGSAESKIHRGGKMTSEVEYCLKWLDSVETAGSVVYVCFGSLNEFELEQLDEIALGLEESGYDFVWVMRNKEYEQERKGKKGRGRGTIIRGWAPQTLILNHPAVGGFVTHCGWNSTLEGITAGVPMATWPVEYEQFVNEKLIDQVLGIGVRVERGEGVVRKEAVAKAVAEVMGGGSNGDKRRDKAKEYAAMATAAVEEGGSSYVDTASLIQELREFRAQAQPAHPSQVVPMFQA